MSEALLDSASYKIVTRQSCERMTYDAVSVSNSPISTPLFLSYLSLSNIVYLSIHPSVRLSIHPSIQPSIHPSIDPSSIDPSIY